MMRDFLGKFSFAAASETPPPYLCLIQPTPATDPVCSFDSVEPVQWVTYDAGQSNGQQLCIIASPAPNPLFLYVDPSLGWIRATAAPITPLAVFLFAGTGTATWQRYVSGEPETAGYLLQNFFQGLVFPAPPVGGALTSMQTTLITQGMPAIRSSKSAAGYDFTGVDLSGTSFAGIDCTGADFTGAILAGTDFSGAILTNAVFSGTDLTQTSFGTNIQANGARFDNCIASGASFATDASQPGTQASFARANFTNADFSGTEFGLYTDSGGTTTGANLSNAILYGANFSGARLPGANLTGALAGQSGSGGNVGADFSRAYMPDVNLSEADLDGADLSQAQVYFLAQGTLKSANLTNANLAGADFSGMSFQAATMAGVNADAATLIGCSFKATFAPSAQFLPVSMVGAHLEGADFTGASLTGVHLAGASIATSDGVPLFAALLDPSYPISLNAGRLPATLPALFAAKGVALFADADVAEGAQANRWTLSQTPVSMTMGVEITGYTLTSDGTNLRVYASSLNLREQVDIGIVGLDTEAILTKLTVGQLDDATRCPNGSTVRANGLRSLCWEEMLTVDRVPLVSS